MKPETFKRAKELEVKIANAKATIVFLSRIENVGLSSWTESEDQASKKLMTSRKNIDVKVAQRRYEHDQTEENTKKRDLLQALDATPDTIGKDLVVLIDKHIQRAEMELKQLEAEFEALQD